MAAEYPYPVINIPDVATKLLLLDQKLLIDLDLSPYYIGNIYDMETNNIIVQFNTVLNSFLQNTLFNIVQIIIYEAKVQADVYIVDYNKFNRRSPKTATAPTINHDANLGYSVGSTVLTLSNDIYICTNNTNGAAVWRKILFEV